MVFGIWYLVFGDQLGSLTHLWHLSSDDLAIWRYLMILILAIWRLDYDNKDFDGADGYIDFIFFIKEGFRKKSVFLGVSPK